MLSKDNMSTTKANKAMIDNGQFSFFINTSLKTILILAAPKTRQTTNSFLVGQLLLESGPKISIRWRCTYHHSPEMTNYVAAKVNKIFVSTK